MVRWMDAWNEGLSTTERTLFFHSLEVEDIQAVAVDVGTRRRAAYGGSSRKGPDSLSCHHGKELNAPIIAQSAEQV